jgi:UDP-glucose 4-epimerase
LAKPDLDLSSNVSRSINSAVDALSSFATQCAEHGVSRLIFASSAAVYGTRAMTPRRETEQVQSHSPYAALKLRSEAALMEVGASSALSVLAFRIFNVYGPGFSNSLVNRLVTGDGSTPSVYGTDNFVRDYIHAADVAQAFGSAVGAASFDSTILNLGTGLGTSNRSLLDLCPKAVYRDAGNFEGSSVSIANISLLRSHWRFEPRVLLEAAVRFPDEFLHSGPQNTPPTTAD